MDKRVSSRAIIIENNEILLMFRRKIKDGIKQEYYAIPGGGKEEGETLEENVIRELKEEFNVDIKLNGFIGKRETEKTIEYFFSASIIKGTPTLSGEELERMTPDNYYEVRKVSLDDINNIDVKGVELILKAKNKEFEKLS